MRSRAVTWLLPLSLPFLVALPGCDSDEGGGTEGAEGTGSTTSGVSASSEAPTTAPDPSGATVTSTTSDDTSAGTTGEATGPGGTTGAAESSSGGEPLGSPGCGAAAQLAEGEHQLLLDELDRRYIVRLPQNYDPTQPWPLIFALHGNGGDPGYWDGTDPDRDLRTAFANEAILIIPEAINNAWRDYDADSATWPAGIELELNFFDTLLETAHNELCIDTQNVFSMGFSGGGSFSGLLGCRRDYIRAIAVGGSVIYFDEEVACQAAPASWITIGDGELEPPREAFRDFFVGLGGCQPTSTPGAPEGCVNYDGCGLDTPVTFCSHPADHVWPSIGTEAMRTFFRSFYAAR